VAPGGTLIQFAQSDQPVEADFVEQRPGTTSTGGLTAIDHVTLGLTIEQLDTWVLFTRAVLGLTAGDAVGIAAPSGALRGVAVTNDTRTLRMLLKASVIPSAGTRRHSDPASNAVVDSIALGCNDIFATVERLRGKGVSFVPISGNYYDDLIARDVVDAATVERMRGQDIVFAGSASSGTFYQAFTETFEGRFSFQIVQRTEYEGYGEENEPLRVASLEQLRQLKEWLQPWL
jgi:4-hydroxyphenylpyruvate dioxygenase